MYTRTKLGASWGLAVSAAMGVWLFVLPGFALAQIRLDTTCSSATTGNPYYKVEQVAPANTGLAKLICATPHG